MKPGGITFTETRASQWQMGKHAKSCFCKAKWRTGEKGPMVVRVTTSNSDLLDLKSWRKPYRLPVWRSRPPCVTSASKPAHNRWSTVAHVPGALVDVRQRREGNPGWEQSRKEFQLAGLSLEVKLSIFTPEGLPTLSFWDPHPLQKTFLSCLRKGYDSLRPYSFLFTVIT